MDEEDDLAGGSEAFKWEKAYTEGWSAKNGIKEFNLIIDCMASQIVKNCGNFSWK